MPVAKRHILRVGDLKPAIASSAFVGAGAVVVGDVTLSDHSSIWYGAVVRGDVAPVHIGPRTNIQDGTVIHVASASQPVSATSRTPSEGYPTLIGDNVTVGHMVLLHACVIENDAFVGMKSAVMDGAKIESGGMLAAGALLTAGKVVGRGQLWAGSPAKFWRDLIDADKAQFDLRANQYAQLGQEYLKAPQS